MWHVEPGARCGTWSRKRGARAKKVVIVTGNATGNAAGKTLCDNRRLLSARRVDASIGYVLASLSVGPGTV
ncbi:hypothetical protein, partial [Frankia sp. Cr2]|uniref:hypothetical protein n=1 Tax=Frankia sp. Cr2 TaxID=3073932 RepID=UPI002AD29578